MSSEGSQRDGHEVMDNDAPVLQNHLLALLSRLPRKPDSQHILGKYR